MAEADTNTKPSKQKASRAFDFSKHPKKHICFRIAYHGQTHDGLARQLDTTNTIEHHLLSALAKVCLIPPVRDPEHPNNPAALLSPEKFSRCGRTDKGVSALGNAVSLVVRCAKDGDPELQYCRMLNKNLPETIRVISWAFVPDAFDARFSCVHRTYRYFFTDAQGSSSQYAALFPFQRSGKTPPSSAASGSSMTNQFGPPGFHGPLNVHRMAVAAAKLVGSHDFRNFCKMDVVNVSNFVREILSVRICRADDAGTEEEIGGDSAESKDDQRRPRGFFFEIRGNAFLYHQIRCIMSVLFMVGEGSEEPSIVDDLLDLEKFPKKPCYQLAPDAPLVLWDCAFGDDVVKWNVEANAVGEMLSEFSDMTTAAIMRASMTMSMQRSVASFAAERCHIIQHSTSSSSSAGTATTDASAADAGSRRHKKLEERQTEASFEERVDGLSGSKKRRRDVNQSYGDESSTTAAEARKLAGRLAQQQ